MQPRLFDRTIQQLLSKRYMDDLGKRQKLFEPNAMKLRLAMRHAEIFSYSDEAWRAADQFSSQDGDLIIQFLPRLRLPLPQSPMWIEPLSIATGELPDDISTEAFFIESAPKFGETAFQVTLLAYKEDEGMSWGLGSLIFNPIEKIYGSANGKLPAMTSKFIALSKTDKKSILAEEHNAWIENDKTYKDNESGETLADSWKKDGILEFLSHCEITENPYAMQRGISIEMIANRLPEDFCNLYRALMLQIRGVVCLLLVLNLGGKLAPEFSEPQTHKHTGLLPDSKEYLTHRTVTIKIGAEEYVREVVRRAVGMGTRKKRHQVIEHWCVSRRVGKAECAGVRRVCKPRVIDARSNACEFCPKIEWRRDQHMRGDATLGFISHDYVVDIKRNCNV